MIRSKKLRESARGQECTLQIAGICICAETNQQTTILAHFPDEYKGGSQKSSDISAGFACRACHDVVDGRTKYPGWDQVKDFYLRRSNLRTIEKWVEMGNVVIK